MLHHCEQRRTCLSCICALQLGGAKVSGQVAFLGSPGLAGSPRQPAGLGAWLGDGTGCGAPRVARRWKEGSLNPLPLKGLVAWGPDGGRSLGPVGLVTELARTQPFGGEAEEAMPSGQGRAQLEDRIFSVFYGEKGLRRPMCLVWAGEPKSWTDARIFQAGAADPPSQAQAASAPRNMGAGAPLTSQPPLSLGACRTLRTPLALCGRRGTRTGPTRVGGARGH